MQKIKNWLSEENNVYLIRDLLFVFSLLAAFMVFLFGCQRAIPMARADEIETVAETEATLPKMTLPKLPDLSQVEDLPNNFTDLKFVFSFNSNKDVYAAIIRVKNMGQGLSNPILQYSSSDGKYIISLGYLNYGDVYKLEKGAWALKSSNTLKSSNAFDMFISSDISTESFNYAYKYQNCLLYQSVGSSGIKMFISGPAGSSSSKSIEMALAADVTFSGSSSGGSSSSGGTIDTSTSFGQFASDTVTTSKSLFEVAKSTVSFLYKNPICILGLILFVICAACGISKNFVRGV